MSFIQRGNAVKHGTARRTLIVLPCPVARVLSDQADRQWLAGSTVRTLAPNRPLLDRLLNELYEPPAPAARAALRFWGQTGRPPASWIAAADPVWMQAGLESLFLHVPPADEIDIAALRVMLKDLHDALLSGREMTFESHEEHGYLWSAKPVCVAELPATSIDRSRPGDFMPDANDAASREYYALSSEIEMSLFAHSHNRDRERQGQRPLNALWLWGGGSLDGHEPRRLPLIFTSDALLKGFYSYSESRSVDWPGTLTACLAMAQSGFVAVPAAGSEAQLNELIAELRSLWQSRRLPDLTVLFDDVAVDPLGNWRRYFTRGIPAQLRAVLNEQQ